MTGTDCIGEVIATTTVGFLAQSPALHTLPSLGSLVKVATSDTPAALHIYAVVAYAETSGIDAGRRAVRRGTDEITDHDIYREHPELVHILRTTFQARIVGYSEQGRPRQFLPPTPPPLHFSVRTCTPDEVHLFTDNLIYLRLLLDYTGDVSPEQLIAAHIRSTAAVRGHDEQWLFAAGREMARLYKDEYDRLLSVLQAIDPVHQAPVG